MRHFTIGVDVAKDHLDACRLPDREVRRFPNTAQGRRALVRWAGGDIDRVVFEPTGHYARPLERDLADAGLAAVKVNPARARRFAEACSPRPTASTPKCWPAWDANSTLSPHRR